MVNDRNRRRRWPWIPAAIAGVAGLSAHFLGAGLHTLSADIAPTVLAWPATLAPLIGTLAFTLRHRHAATRWLPELAVFGFGSAALTYLLAIDGPSPFIALVALVATIISATRWWRAHPIGPQVKRLVPPELAPITPAVPDPERDPYCVAWLENNASKDGKAPGSRLTNRRDDEFTTNYDIALKRGHQTVHDLQPNRAKLAGGLGEDTERVLFKAPPRGMGAHWARMTIIRKDPVADTRFYTGPQVEDGVIKNVARLVDGSGEMDVTMWDDNGTVGTMIVGSTGGGKSGAANIVTCSAMSTGLLNLLYADPKGNSSTALATRARVAVIGKQNVLRLPQLMTAMLAARAELAAELSSDLIFPSREIPGWMLLHDEYSLIASDPGAQKTWTETVNIVRAYGMWAVALNQSLGQPQWGTDHARSAFASQVVAFRINSKSGSDLVPGLTFDPNDLPVDDRGRPVPGMAVHAHHDTPTRWDFLPSTADAERMAAKELPAPPITTVTAFDEFFAQPDLHPLDEAAITSVLGPAVNGRWQVGGPGATHQFRSGDAAPGPGAGPTDFAPKQPTRGRWGQRGTSASGSHHAALTPVQAEVLEIVRGGTGVTGEIVEAATAARSSVMNALDVLIDRELIEKLSHGRYQHIPMTSTST
ncbi:MarR family transcriptional regulator [Pseudonocardia parietis]|uniref:Uncharacterized protein n=1 Tax=Pseudonocardia parietis TaxID=570936 RepID=A0ABS4W561_9PSEU|nr:MarR family transcriptional regulator [Pseudonocardia parietis]MBP2371355.1 hypothetical protein [Pseudonocardia parietis]